MKRLLAPLFVLAIAACTYGAVPETRTVVVTASTVHALTAGPAPLAVDHVTVLVDSAASPAAFLEISGDLVLSGGVWTGTIDGIPEGDVTFTGVAYGTSDRSDELARSAPVARTISASPVSVPLLLEQDIPPAAFVDAAPSIDVMTVSASSVQTGHTIDIDAAASDADGTGDIAGVEWTDDCSGAFSPGDDLTTTWTAGGSSACHITLTVTDNDGVAATLSFTETVTP